MTGFIIGAVVAVLLSLALLLRPFLRMSGGTQASRRQLNAAILREQLARLEQDLADGTLRQEDYAQARAEVQRRVLEDTSQEDAAPTLRAPKRTLAGLALLVPLAAIAVYFAVGNPKSMNAAPQLAKGAGQQDIERMVQTLADKLEQDPGNLKGWAMLARSYKVMGRPADAQKAFERAGSFLDGDAQLLADYADVAITNANGDFAGKPAQLLEKALQVDPKNLMALWLAGGGAFAREDYGRAIGIWQRLVQLLPPESEDRRNITTAIEEARARGGKGGDPAVAVAAQPSSAGASIAGRVELDPALAAKAGPGDTVMVIARVPGTRMPVAVLRVRVADLPAKYTLDDSLAMSPQARISMASEVEVEARISKSGLAKPEPGDLISSVQTVKVGAKGVTLHVGQVRQ